MKPRNAWAVAFALSALVVTFARAATDEEAKDSGAVPSAIRYETNVSAGGVNPAGITLENPHSGNPQSAQTGERLFSTMNCDGCHGGGALGFIGPSLVDGRWHYGGADQAIFHSIFYGRPKGMPAYGGLLGSEGVWLIVTYLKSQPVPNVGATISYEGLATTATLDANRPTSPVALQSALPATGVEGLVTKYGCVACHASEKKGVGPAFKDVATKYRGQSDAAAYLAMQVKNGGTGVWGTIPMPPHSDVPNTDLETIIAWILAAK